jgi:hypothetical protein
VPQQFLDSSNIVPVLEQVSRKRVAEGVRTHALRDSGVPRSVRDGLLDNGLVKMKARRRPPSWIGADARGGKDELPAPLGGRVRILAVERERQDGRPVLLVFSAANDNLPSFEIEVFDAQLKAWCKQSNRVAESVH